MELEIANLYQRYGPMVLRRCRQLLNNEAHALDAMQDVFVRLTEQKHRLTADAPSSLLYRMATNHCLNVIRDNKRLVSLDGSKDEDENEDASDKLLSSIANTHDSSEQVMAENLLNKLFNRHPESSRTMAVLHFYDGMTLEEVANHVGMSVSGVRKRLRLLQTSLRALQGDL